MSQTSSSSFIAHPGATRGCPSCTGGGYAVERQGSLAAARLCDCVSGCPRCDGTGFVRAGEGRDAPVGRCTCQVLEGRIRRFNEARIPARHAGSTRASFDFGGSRGAAFTGVAKWLRDYRPGEESRGLVLYGEVGRGKTHLMVAMLRELVFEHGVSARFVEFSHLLADLKTTFDRGSGAADILEPLSRVRVLAIDELGKGRNTEWEGTVLDELVSRRYNAAATILATTNYPPRAATGRPQPNLARPEDKPSLVDRVGPRVFSRLVEMCDFVETRGRDYRERTRGA